MRLPEKWTQPGRFPTFPVKVSLSYGHKTSLLNWPQKRRIQCPQDKDRNLRYKTAWALGEIKPINEKIHVLTAKVFKREEESVWQASLEVLEKMQNKENGE